MTRRTKLLLGVGGLSLILLFVFGYVFRSMGKTEGSVPTTRVRHGAVDLTVTATGELRSPQSAMIVAPPVGGALQILELAQNGGAVKSGDVIVQFDPSEQEFSLEQGRSLVAESEQQIIKSKADAAVQAAQDKVALLKAKFAVRRAELEVGKNELVGEIEAKKNVLALNEAKRRLAQLEQDVVSRRSSNNAGIAVQEQQREEARLKMLMAHRNIDNMKVTSPMDGIISIKENTDASGGFFYPGMVLPEYREGDQVNPGRMVAQVFDIKTLEVSAKVNETDRANVTPGTVAELKVDLAPGKRYRAKVKSVANLASRNWWSANAVSKFDVTFEIANPDDDLRPGASAQVTIKGASLANTLFLPRQCLFQKDGKLVVYVRDGQGFKPQDIKVVNQTEDRIVVDGLAEGTEVSLLDPTASERSGSGSKSSDTGVTR
jgi:multidrug resistance efflux pump